MTVIKLCLWFQLHDQDEQNSVQLHQQVSLRYVSLNLFYQAAAAPAMRSLMSLIADVRAESAAGPVF